MKPQLANHSNSTRHNNINSLNNINIINIRKSLLVVLEIDRDLETKRNEKKRNEKKRTSLPFFFFEPSLVRDWTKQQHNSLVLLLSPPPLPLAWPNHKVIIIISIVVSSKKMKINHRHPKDTSVCVDIMYSIFRLKLVSDLFG